MKGLSNAFASPRSTRDHTELIDDVARRIVRRRMTTPVLLLLESTAPLTRLAAQALCVASPLLSLLITYQTLDDFVDMMQEGDNIQKLIHAIQRYEKERRRAHD